MTYEKLGFWYVVIFFICQLINVALNTAKTIIMHKEEKVSSAIINAVTYGFYTVIIVMTASSLPLWITIIVTIITNLIGVYVSMLVLEKLKKDSVWEITATLCAREWTQGWLKNYLNQENISFNAIQTNMIDEYVYHIYSYNQKESRKIKKALDYVQAKYIVHEEKVKL